MPGSSTPTPVRRRRKRRRKKSLKCGFMPTSRHTCKVQQCFSRKLSMGGLCKAAADLVFQDGVLEAAHLVVFCVVVFHLEEPTCRGDQI